LGLAEAFIVSSALNFALQNEPCPKQRCEDADDEHNSPPSNRRVHRGLSNKIDERSTS
jgi:hypothetical protein